LSDKGDETLSALKSEKNDGNGMKLGGGTFR
jgi:hypothetical protein